MWPALLALGDLAFASEREHIEVTVGDNAWFSPPRVPSAIAVTDPHVAIAYSTRFCCQIQGIQPGTTDLVLQFGPGVPPLFIDITVVPDLSQLRRAVRSLALTGHIPALSASKADPRPLLEVPLGTVIDLYLGRPADLARITLPELCTATLEGNHLLLACARLGTTDLLLVFEGEEILVDLVVQRDIGDLRGLVDTIAR